MDDLKNTKVKEQYTVENSFVEIIKIFIYSSIGILIFFIPIEIDNQTKTLLYHMSDKIQLEIKPLIEASLIFFTSLGCIKLYYEEKKKNLCFRAISIIIMVIIFYGKSSYFFIDENSALLIEDIILNTSILLPLSAIFMVFILDYGFLDIIESYFQKIMKTLFKLSGKSIVNILFYICTDCFCGYFMTNKLYKDGKIRENEACMIILNFSIISYPMIIYTAEELNINKIDFLLSSILILFVANIILCRIYPLNNKKRSYSKKTNYKETIHKKNKFEKAIKKYLQNNRKKNIFKSMLDNLEESINVLMNLLPKIIIIIFLGSIIINNTGIIDLFKYLIYPIGNILKIPNISDLGRVTSTVLYNDVIAIDMVNKNLEYAMKFLIGIIICLKSVSITGNIIYSENSDIKLNKKDFFIAYMERILIILFIYWAVYYFYSGYIK